MELEGTDRLSGPGESQIASGSKRFVLHSRLLAATRCPCSGLGQWTADSEPGGRAQSFGKCCVWQTLLTVKCFGGMLSAFFPTDALMNPLRSACTVSLVASIENGRTPLANCADP